MSIPEQIRALEELAGVDAELKVLDDQLSQERATLAALKAWLKRLEEKRKTDLLSVAATDKARNELVTDVRGMMQQLDHSREKLNRSRTERESNAAQRELEELRKLVRDREEDIDKLTAEGDAVRAQIEARRGRGREGPGRARRRREGDINSKVAEVERQRAAEAGRARRHRQASPARALPPIRDVCGRRSGVRHRADDRRDVQACNMSLPPQLFHRLRREPMIEQCPSCQRIIYFVPPLARPAPRHRRGGEVTRDAPPASWCARRSP